MQAGQDPTDKLNVQLYRSIPVDRLQASVERQEPHDTILRRAKR
jgi:hypothetical protein